MCVLFLLLKRIIYRNLSVFVILPVWVNFLVVYLFIEFLFLYSHSRKIEEIQFYWINLFQLNLLMLLKKRRFENNFF